ncbi:MAG TPA: hypothetical protein VHF22_04860 [Planctomycetota bacterium]|nr:hypothetical protein [Planctomycetota bacterium]
MSTFPPRPPGHALARRPAGANLGALTFRFAIMATIASIVLIGFQANRYRKAAEAEAAAHGEGWGSAESVTGTAAPVGETETADEDEVEPPPPDDPHLVKFMGLLDGVADYDDVAQNQAYAALAEHVHNLTDEEAARILHKKLHYKQLLREPKVWRGEMLHADGLLIDLTPVRLAPGAGPPGVEDAWRGILMEPGGDEGFMFDLIGDPPDISKKSLVRVEGAFLKIVRFEAGEPHPKLDARGRPVVDANGKLVPETTRDAPFLVARRAWQLEESELPRPFRYDYVVVVLGSLVGVFILVQRKKAAQDQALLDSKRAELQRRLSRKSKPKPPTGEATT